MSARFEVRACWWTQRDGVTSVPYDGHQAIWPPPEFWGVYENQEDGTQQWVSDHRHRWEAVVFADWLNAAPAGVRPVGIDPDRVKDLTGEWT